MCAFLCRNEMLAQWILTFSSRSVYVCVSVCVGEIAQPDSAGRQASLLTADEIECLLTQGASATRARLHLYIFAL